MLLGQEKGGYIAISWKTYLIMSVIAAAVVFLFMEKLKTRLFYIYLSLWFSTI